jgi:hypothetical protein
VSGLNLASMEASDMLDVIHYFYDDDNRYNGYDEAKIVSGFRDAVYRIMYKTDYSFKMDDDESEVKNFDDLEFDDSGSMEKEEPVVPFNPRASNVKPYTPPTEFKEDSSKPFGSILDAPLS